ncbi:MAG: hypothetical protein M1821_007428 [Bathelium mastoideum]|nr:MAG: hypothetical protein M1821_007428 [Bathelium mastoideum]
MSEKLVAVTDISATCYVLSLENWEQKSLRWPSARIHAETARDWTIAALVADVSFHSMIIYNFENETTCSFPFPVQAGSKSTIALLLQPEHHGIVVLTAERPFEPLERSALTSKRCSYSGKLLSKGALALTGPSSLNRGGFVIDKVSQIDDDGNYQVWPDYAHMYSRPGSLAVMDATTIVYNEKTDKLLFLGQVNPQLPNSAWIRSSSWWKDTEFFSLDMPHASLRLKQERLDQERKSDEHFRKGAMCFVNDHYLVAFGEKLLHMWCFDEDRPLPPGSDNLPGEPRPVQFSENPEKWLLEIEP